MRGEMLISSFLKNQMRKRTKRKTTASKRTEPRKKKGQHHRSCWPWKRPCRRTTWRNSC
jgi:hypothetical protein